MPRLSLGFFVGSSLVASDLFISLLLLVLLVVVIGGGFAVGGRVEGKLRAKHAACTAEEG